jgi:N-glycosylase/DNA lyase
MIIGMDRATLRPTIEDWVKKIDAERWSDLSQKNLEAIVTRETLTHTSLGRHLIETAKNELRRRDMEENRARWEYFTDDEIRALDNAQRLYDPQGPLADSIARERLRRARMAKRAEKTLSMHDVRDWLGRMRSGYELAALESELFKALIEDLERRPDLDPERDKIERG